MKSLFNFLLRRNQQDESAHVAMERLQIIVSHRKGNNQQQPTTYLQDMQQELIAVIAKYVQVEDNNVKVNLAKAGSNDVLEINIALPEKPQC